MILTKVDKMPMLLPCQEVMHWLLLNAKDCVVKLSLTKWLMLNHLGQTARHEERKAELAQERSRFKVFIQGMLHTTAGADVQ